MAREMMVVQILHVAMNMYAVRSHRTVDSDYVLQALGMGYKKERRARYLRSMLCEREREPPRSNEGSLLPRRSARAPNLARLPAEDAELPALECYTCINAYTCVDKSKPACFARSEFGR